MERSDEGGAAAAELHRNRIARMTVEGKSEKQGNEEEVSSRPASTKPGSAWRTAERHRGRFDYKSRSNEILGI